MFSPPGLNIKQIYMSFYIKLFNYVPTCSNVSFLNKCFGPEAYTQKIEKFIEKDSTHDYISSPDGFWYRYIKKSDSESMTPKKGQIVQLTYDISDLNNVILYSESHHGIKEYRIDNENFIPALQKGIKFMKVGETVQFVIPPYSAFGIIGDGNKIGMNTSIVSTVTLIDIK